MMEYKKWEKGKLRPDGQPGFDTPSGKFEIWSTVLEDYGYEPLPRYTEVEEGPIANPVLARDYPLVFNSGARPQTDFRSQHHGIKGLLKDNPEPIIEMNPADAGARGIATGDLVEVRTPRGRVPFRGRLTADIVAGAVECNQGGGTPVGPKAWQEWNVNELTDLENYDAISGFPVYKALLCEVAKIADGSERTKRSASKKIKMRERKSKAVKAAHRPSKKHIYLDNNATTRVDDSVRKAMLPFLEAEHGNPASIYAKGREAHEAIENARRQVAKLINAKPRRIIFTGSGSEADNLALKGVAFACRIKGNHIITSTIEHPAILETCAFLEKLDYRITYLDVDEFGLLQPSDLEAAMTDKTILVSLMMANNEVGTILPIRELCAVAHKHGVFFHTDAVQAVGKIGVDVEDLGVDLLSLSGHKFYGPKGVGALYVKKGIELESLIHGGKQEGGKRAGTHNVPAIVGLGKAAELAMKALAKSTNVKKLRDRLENGIRDIIPAAVLNGHPAKRLPNTLNLTLPGLRGESLVIALDQHGISLSSGSACKSGAPEPTHVLMAMGKSEADAHCSVRFSLSHEITLKDIEETIASLKQVLDEMETTIRFLPCK